MTMRPPIADTAFLQSAGIRLISERANRTQITPEPIALSVAIDIARVVLGGTPKQALQSNFSALL